MGDDNGKWDERMGDDRMGDVNSLAVRSGSGKAGKLGSEQEAALAHLLSGKSLVESARFARISRQTLYRWMKEDPVFQAAYNQWQEEMRNSARARLMAMSEKAAKAVETALERGDAKTAMQLLKGLGFLR